MSAVSGDSKSNSIVSRVVILFKQLFHLLPLCTVCLALGLGEGSEGGMRSALSHYSAF